MSPKLFYELFFSGVILTGNIKVNAMFFIIRAQSIQLHQPLLVLTVIGAGTGRGVCVCVCGGGGGE